MVTRRNLALVAGDLAAAQRHNEEYAEFAEHHHIALSLPNVTATRAEFARIRGDFAAADRLLREAAAQEVDWGASEDRGGNSIGVLLYLRAQQGQLAEDDQLRRNVEALGRSLLGPAITAPYFALVGLRDECRAVFESPEAIALTERPPGGALHLVLAGLSEACIFLEDSARAPRLYEHLTPHADYNLLSFAGAVPTWFGPADRYLGLLAAVMGRWDDAERHLLQALALVERMPSPPYIAQVRYDYACMLLRRGRDEDRPMALELLNEAAEAARKIGMAGLVRDVVERKLQLQGLAGADIHTSIDAVHRQVQTEHPDLRDAAADDGSVTIMFSDIAGSTARAEELGDERWLELIRSHNAIVRGQVQAHNGREVANRGDGFMVAFASPRAAVDCAIAVQRAFAAHTSAHEHEPIEVHIGLHTGRPAQDEGNFYGTDVNLAARIADHVAQAGQIVVSERLRQALRGSRSLRFDEGREVELKGLSGKHRVFEVVWDQI